VIFPGLPLVRREMLETHPLFVEKISCLVLIMGETGQSGRDAGLDGSGICLLCHVILERFLAKFCGSVRFEIRAENGRFPHRFVDSCELHG